MNVLWLFDTCGLIVGPAVFLAGLVALGLCLWATWFPGRDRLRRIAVAAAVSPVVIAVLGAGFGLIVWWVERVPGAPWLALGKVCLAGLAVAAIPLCWSLFLVNRGPVGAAPVRIQ